MNLDKDLFTLMRDKWRRVVENKNSVWSWGFSCTGPVMTYFREEESEEIKLNAEKDLGNSLLMQTHMTGTGYNKKFSVTFSDGLHEVYKVTVRVPEGK